MDPGAQQEREYTSFGKITNTGFGIGQDDEDWDDFQATHRMERDTKVTSRSTRELSGWTREIFHIAFLLKQKLPADLVPNVLDHAEIWEEVSVDNTSGHDLIIDEAKSPALQKRSFVPSYIPPGSVRALRFSFGPPEGVPFVNDSETAVTSHEQVPTAEWLECGIVEFDDARTLKPFEYNYGTPLPTKAVYKNGSWKIVELTIYSGLVASASRWVADDENEDVRRALKSLGSGCAIELSAFRSGPGVFTAYFRMAIDLEYAVVRKM